MIKLNKLKLAEKIENHDPIKMTFKYINEDLLVITNSILARILAYTDQIFLLNSVITVLREIQVNALKANAKRVFFKMQDFDINNKNDYERGIIYFKNRIIGEFEKIEPDLINSDYYVETIFQTKDDQIEIQVINNAQILPEEMERIKFRIKKALTLNDFTEAFEEIQDSTEGAGLGIVLTILLLSNMGIDPKKNMRIEKKGDCTAATLIIPQHLRPLEVISTVKDRILNEIEGIPTFPENILVIQKLCNDPDVTIEELSRRISADPALTSDIIKLSNSAGFVPGKRIETIPIAIKTIGFKNVNAVLIATSARRILNERYSIFEQIWDHCNKTAFYARNIASKYKLNGIIENAFIAGLLHDLGKIILLATDVHLTRKIAEIVQDRKVPVTSTVIEEISIGISHSSIGALIAKKWNFPEYLVNAINHHHSPLSVPAEFRELVYTVYLANMFCGIETRKYNFYYVEENVLQFFKLEDEDAFKACHELLKKQYEHI